MHEGWIGELAAATGERDGAATRLAAFLSEPRGARSLALWLAQEPGEPAPSAAALRARLLRDIAAIDALLERQLNALLHHPSLQRLEASWRGLHWLIEDLPTDGRVKVRVLSASWKELARDAERAMAFDQSQLFRKVYTAEFGTPGGEPYGILLGDYYLAHRPRADQPIDDVRTLKGVVPVAAAAFAPFVASIHPALLGLDTLRELERPLDLPRTFRGVEYIAWRALRDSEDSRFVALTLPRVLLRAPYGHDPERRDSFPFAELCATHEDYLWGNACFALGRVVVRAFERWGWLADIRGTQRGQQSGGLVSGLPALDHGTDSPGVAQRFATEVVINDRDDRVLSDLGLIALSGAPGDPSAVFYSTPSLQAPAHFTHPEATLNARLSAQLQYVLCASRIAHYIKVICRDLTGSLLTARELERRLAEWLRSITISSENASDELQARFPLRDANVAIRELPGSPGSFSSVIHLCPHFQLDQMSSTMRLVTEIALGR